MAKIAVCDGNQSDLALTAEYVRLYGTQNGLPLEVDTFTNCNILSERCAKFRYPIIFMEIFYRNQTAPIGLSVAWNVKEKWGSRIIFQTTDREYAVEGFQIGALHYLLKPCGYEGVREALDRCGCLKREYRELEFRAIGEGPVKIACRDILYVECFNRELEIHTRDRVCRVYLTIHRLFERLDPALFCFPQRSFIVNCAFIESITGRKMTLKDGTEIGIGRNNLAPVREQFIRYRQMYERQ